MIKKFLQAKRTVEVFGSGTQKRSYVAVKDLVDALLLLADKGESGQAYNVDAQEEHSVKEIVVAIQGLIRKSVTVQFNRLLPEGSRRRMLDNQKIRSLGWAPKRNLVDALPELVRDVRRRMHEK